MCNRLGDPAVLLARQLDDAGPSTHPSPSAPSPSPRSANTTWMVLGLVNGRNALRGRAQSAAVGLYTGPGDLLSTSTAAWAVTMLRRRKLHAKPNDWDVVFTAPLGGLRDPRNTQRDLRAALDRAGYPWATSHSCRKTVATLMDEAGLTARAAADQLGHAKVSMTQDHYFGRKIRRTGAATVLEAVAKGA